MTKGTKVKYLGFLDYQKKGKKKKGSSGATPGRPLK